MGTIIKRKNFQKNIIIFLIEISVLTIFGQSSLFSQIIINEIMAYPVNSEPEWIELYNSGTEMIASDSLIISDISKKYPFYIQNFKPNSYCVLVKDTSLLKTFRNIPEDAYLIETKIPSLNNDGDSLRLYDTKGMELDSFFYSGKWQKKGYSLERVASDFPATSNENVKPSTANDSATCGMKNSSQTEIHDSVPPITNLEFIQNPFSPNSTDGKNKCIFKLSITENSIIDDIKIYNLNGGEVKNIDYPKDVKVSGSYQFEWDGTNASGYLVQPGNYALIVKMTNSQGAVQEFRKIIVVAP